MKCGWSFAFILIQSLYKRHGTEIRILGYCSLVIFCVACYWERNGQ